MDNRVLTTEEQSHLREIREVTQTANSAGYHILLRQIEAFVSESHEDMLANVDPRPERIAWLQTRWQQREAMLRGIKSYVAACEEEKKMLLMEAKERSVPPDYAEQGGETSRWEDAHRA